MKTTLIFIGVILVLILTIYILGKVIKSKNITLKEKEQLIKTLKDNINSLVLFSAKNNEILQAEVKHMQELKDAQTDEEVNAIISNIINANNKRVQNTAKK